MSIMADCNPARPGIRPDASGQPDASKPPLVTALVLSDGDQGEATATAAGASVLADEVMVLERSVIDWTDNVEIGNALESVDSEWILVLGAGEQLRVTEAPKARIAVRNASASSIGVMVGLSAEVRLHRNEPGALQMIGSAASEICRDVSISADRTTDIAQGPAVSVIIPTFNRPEMLKRCLEGLSVQTTDDFEVIVVNDAGLDVGGIVEGFSGRLDVRLITQPNNGGPATAANAGLSVARGRYGHFQADDDTILPHHVKLLRSALDETRISGDPAGVVYGPAFLIEESETGEEVDRRIIFSAEASTGQLLWQNFIVGGTAMFDLDVARAIGGMNTDLEVLEDWDFWLRMSNRADIVFVDTPTAEYRLRTGTANLTTQAKPRFYSNLLRLYEAHPVDPESPIALRRDQAVQEQIRTHRDSHAWDHTVAIIGDGDLDAMVACLQSVSAAAPGASIQLIVHEVRSPAAEVLLSDLAGVATVCLRLDADASLIERRIEQQAGGREVTVLRSCQLLVASTLPETMCEALDGVSSRLVELPGIAKAKVTPGLDYVSDASPRYGYRSQTHSRIETLLSGSHDACVDVLDSVMGEFEQLRKISVEPQSSGIEPYWNNDFFMGLDAAVLYAMIARERPQRYFEVGSGNSTRFVRRAIVDHELSTRITSIDPEPRADCDLLCDEVIRDRLESTSLDLFDQVQSGDVVFYDGSHRALMNSDTTVFFLDVLPALPPGTLVHVHDIFWPCDYPAAWADRMYSEQYLLAARLLTPDPGLDIVFPGAHVFGSKDLLGRTSRLWRDDALNGARAGWGSFWFRTR